MMTDWLHRLRSLFRRNAVEQELDDELRFHLEQQVAAYVSQGLTPDDARRRARLEFGGLDQIKEEHRDARGVGWVDDLGRDLRYGVRQLRRSPGFAVAALICLGLGIGATTAVYSVVDAILVRPLPFADSDRLVRVIANAAAVPGRPPQLRGLTYQEFLDWRTHVNTFADAAAVTGGGQRLVRTSNGSAGLWGTTVSPNMFSMLGVRPLLGRTLVSGDEVQGDVVVLSYETWQRHFNADPAIVGTSLEFKPGSLLGPAPARLLTVVGVLPADFELLRIRSDFYTPTAVPSGDRPGSPAFTMIGRLAPGVPLKAAIDEASAIGAAIQAPLPANTPATTPPRFQVDHLKELTVRDMRPALRVLLASVVVVLLIVCANVANLLLARGTVRQRELAVRVAIGASRSRIIRQIMAESLILAGIGGALGALVGAAGVSLVKQLATVDAPGIFRLMFGSTILPRMDEVGIDIRVLGIAFTVAAVTSVVFGVLPALHLAGTTHAAAMGTRGTSGGRGTSRMRAALTVVQLTMATVLLVGAGLLTHSFIRLATVDNGYDPEQVLAVNLLFPNQYSIARKAETIETLLARFRSVPEVRSAGFSRHGLLIGEEIMFGTFVPSGRALEQMRKERTRLRPVSDGFLTAMGVRVLEGREFEPGDRPTAPPVIVMSRSAARQYFGTDRAIGQIVDWHYDATTATPVTVVGVVEDLRQRSPTDDVFPEIFVDYRQFMFLLDQWKQARRQNELAIGFLSFALRTGSDPSAAVPGVRQSVNAVDPNIGIDVIVPMTRLVSNAVAPQRFYTVMLGAFAGVAAVLAVIGIYGVLAYAVVQRTQEIGIRLSLGAPRAQVLALVLRKGAALAGTGIALGLVGAFAGSRLLQGMLFGITAVDPATFVGVSLMFGVVALLASYVPARRATRIDPVVALRSE